MNKRHHVMNFIVSDAISAIIAWTLFFFYRKYTIDPSIIHNPELILTDSKLFFGLTVVTTSWLLLYFIIGTYHDIFRKSRLKELGQTLLITFIGVLVIFFILILDDQVKSYINYYKSFAILFCFHFFLTFLLRLFLLSHIAKKIQNGKIYFNTLIVGNNGPAIEINKELEGHKYSCGNKIIGFVYVKESEKHPLEAHLTNLGSFKDIKKIIANHKIEEVIIAIDKFEHNYTENIIAVLEETNTIVKIIPDMKDILVGSVKTSAIWGASLIQISPELMPHWQKAIKRILDVFVSIIAMIILLPAYIFTAIGVKFSSKGPVFYSHQRIGLHGKPFKMYKFRSMYIDAEKDGPQLSSKSDGRITRFGRFLRKVRLDEIPQFYHVMLGDMSLVGPRPERYYYIEQIVQRAPHYRLLHKVKPGITSWGQVKYGYAENLDQMVERLKFDILYIENMSLAMDIKILIYTMLIILQGRGK